MFEDFRMDTIEHFPAVDFSPIKLRVATENSLLHMSYEDINVEDDASPNLPKMTQSLGILPLVVYRKKTNL